MAEALIPTVPESCKTCRFWLFISERPMGLPSAGCCRKNPPSGAGFPQVSETGWCGKYEAIA